MDSASRDELIGKKNIVLGLEMTELHFILVGIKLKFFTSPDIFVCSSATTRPIKLYITYNVFWT